MRRLIEHWHRFRQLYQKEIWQPGQLDRFTPRGVLYAILRVVSITWTVFNETKAASRAAALSFSSLLGLGPLVALTVLVAGLVLDKKDPNLAANTLSRLIYFVAPQVGQYTKLDGVRDRSLPAAPGLSDAAPVGSGERPAPPPPPPPASPLRPPSRPPRRRRTRRSPRCPTCR